MFFNEIIFNQRVKVQAIGDEGAVIASSVVDHLFQTGEVDCPSREFFLGGLEVACSALSVPVWMTLQNCQTIEGVLRVNKS